MRPLRHNVDEYSKENPYMNNIRLLFSLFGLAYPPLQALRLGVGVERH